jgi:hypothetical protein
MSRIYCGNNRNDPKLIDNGGTEVVGTRRQCLQKGVGVGSHLPYDASYLNPYSPIDQTRGYCGDNNELPNNYDRFNTLRECFTKGVGIGMRQRALLGPLQPQPAPLAPQPAPLAPRIFNLKNLVLLLIFTAIFIALYFSKPSFLLKGGNDTNKDDLDWEKFLLFHSVLALILIIISIVI